MERNKYGWLNGICYTSGDKPKDPTYGTGFDANGYMTDPNLDGDGFDHSVGEQELKSTDDRHPVRRPSAKNSDPYPGFD